MLERFLTFIKKEHLFFSHQKILLTVSGGMDSVVMTSLFQEAGLQYAIAHCNFGLRGDESDGDEQFVRDLARKYNVKIFCSHFETGKYADQHKISIQMAARDLRYDWFETLCDEYSFDFFASAHHLNDSAETILFNLTKGTGISGLRGMLPKNGRRIRPLLFATHNDIAEYAAKKQLTWREDSSNSSVKYHRNLIRHKVIPLLKEINPNFEATLSSTIERLSAVETIYNKFIEESGRKLVEEKNNTVYIRIRSLLEHTEPLIILFELTEPYGFSYQQAKNILDACQGQPGKHFFSRSYMLNIDREHIIISQKLNIGNAVLEIQKPLKLINYEDFSLHMDIIDRDQVSFEEGENTAYFDNDLLQYPLAVRPWSEGDVFQPLGMKGKKKLSDFIIDRKIPLNNKKDVIVLFSKNDIIWVIGHRIDDRYKITSSTKHVLRIRKK